MKSPNRVSLIVSAALLSLLVLPFAYAQRGLGPGQQNRIYNPATETTLKGTVEAVKTVTGRHGWNGTHLTLKAEGKSYDVHLGPASFIKEKGFSFGKGDQVEVTGSKVEYSGAEAIVAREVKKDGKTLLLRNPQGIPEWAGGYRR